MADWCLMATCPHILSCAMTLVNTENVLNFSQCHGLYSYQIEDIFGSNELLWRPRRTYEFHPLHSKLFLAYRASLYLHFCSSQFLPIFELLL